MGSFPWCGALGPWRDGKRKAELVAVTFVAETESGCVELAMKSVAGSGARGFLWTEVGAFGGAGGVEVHQIGQSLYTSRSVLEKRSLEGF